MNRRDSIMGDSTQHACSLAAEWRSTIPSTAEAIDRFCADFRVWRTAVCARLDGFSSELVLREALTNSVIHGCAEDPNKRITCVLRAKRGRVLIIIQDEGEGFDWRSKWDWRAGASDSHGRGIEILRRHANRVRFNPKGNSVSLIKRFDAETVERL
jgi:serine/threonine-protein kinase RsbW